MGLSNLIKSLFGGGGGGENATATSTPEDIQEYKDFTITPTPIAEGGQYRTAGTISKQQNGEERSSSFIRADNHASRDQAVEHSVTKARQIIDERGDNVLESSHC